MATINPINSGTGISGQFLQSQGEGNDPIFADADLGYATVGPTLGTYATVGDAVTAGKYLIRVIEDTTDFGNIALDANGLDLVIGSGINWTQDDGTFTCAVPAAIRIRGEFLSNVTVSRFAGGDGIATFSGPGIPVGNFIMEDIQVTESGTQLVVAAFSNCASQVYNRVTASCRNSSIFRIDGADSILSVVDTTLIGGGPSCRLLNFDTGTGIFRNLNISGSTNTINSNPFLVINSAEVYDLTVGSPGNNMDLTGCDIYGANISTTATVDLSECLTIVGYRSLPGTVEFNTFSFRPRISDSTFGTVNVTGTGMNGYHFSNCFFSAAHDTQGATGVLYSNCFFDSSMTLNSASTEIYVTGCLIDAAMTIDGDECVVTGGRVGTAGQTITLSATANNNYISGTIVDTAVVDNGTNNDVITKTV